MKLAMCEYKYRKELRYQNDRIGKRLLYFILSYHKIYKLFLRLATYLSF